MKKLIIPMLMLCVGNASMMRAADTDVSTIDNVVYIESFQASAGATALELSIKMKNTAEIRGFQFDIVLPDGVTPVEDSGEYMYWLNANRAPQKAGGQYYHTLEVTKQADGSYRFLCGAQQDKTFTGNDGEVAVIQVNIAAGMAAGEYAISLKNIKLTETDISKFYTTDEVQSTLTVTASSDGRTLLDETSTTVPAAATNVNVRVKRTIKANEWSTLVLPFDMTEAQVKTAFGNDVQLAEYIEHEMNSTKTQLTVTFDDALLAQDGLMANNPYVIKTSKDITEFTVDGVTIAPDEDGAIAEFTNGRSGSRKEVYGTFKGTYHAQTVVPANCLFLSENQFWYSKGLTKMKAFRAYLDLVDVLASVENAGARITMNFGGETTGIGNVNANENDNRYFDLQGRRVLKPGKGLYIRNGKKEVIK